jgi:uncharacterized protein
MIVALSIFGAVVVLGSARVAGLPGSGQWRTASQEAGALAVLGIAQIITISLTLVAGALFGGRLRDVLALRSPPHGLRTYLAALLTMALLQVVGSIALYSLKSGDMFTDLRPFVRLATGPEWPLALAVVAVGAPLSEELLTRGFLLSALAGSRLGFAGAAVVTSGLWTALHAGYSLVGIAEVFLIGLFFSWLLWRTGSLLVPIVCHGIYNGLVLVALRLVTLPA